MHIDWWTLALQTVNVLVLIWILARFFFRPVADIVAKRQEETGKLLADAAAARKQAEDLRAENDKARASFGAERDRLIAEARQAAQAEKADLMAKAATEAERLRSEAKAAMARERADAKQAIVAHASDLSIDIARRLLSRLPAEPTFAAFLDGAGRELRALTPEARQGLAADGGSIEVLTAAPLSEEEMTQVRETLTEALGTSAALTFKNDAALIAGIELHGRNTIVRSSWRADLDRIRKELNRDRHGHQS